jgi:hypothetical protein
MITDSPDPRDIPILTDAVERKPRAITASPTTAVQAAILTQTLELADSLLRRAAKDIDPTLFERAFERLRAELPELVDRLLREYAALAKSAATP